MNVPIVFGSAKGWRYWVIARRRVKRRDRKAETKFVLTADTGDEVWFPDRKTTARCRKFWCHHPRPEKGRLSLRSTCGLHAYKTKHEALAEQFSYPGRVLGEAALWGDVVRHRRGFRGQYGRTLALHETLCAVCHQRIPLTQGALIRGGLWSLISCFPRLNVARKTIFNANLLLRLLECLGVATVLYVSPFLILLLNLFSAKTPMSFYMFIATLVIFVGMAALVDISFIPFSISKIMPEIFWHLKKLVLWNKYLVVCARHVGKERDERLLALSARYYLPIEGQNNLKTAR